MHRRRARPDPVSCQSCRSKKLKCNRVEPCSNCITRGIACNFLIPPLRRVAADSTVPSHSSAELLERIERLEALVLAKNSPGDRHMNSLALTPNSEDVLVTGDQQTRDKDLQLLENVGTREDSLLSSLSSDLAFQTSTTRNILTAAYQSYTTSTVEFERTSSTTVTFPEYKTAVLLLDNYVLNVDHVCRVVHIPTVRSLLKTFYLRMIQNKAVLPGQSALLLSIFAISSLMYQPTDTSEVATTEFDCIRLSRFWSKGALDVLDHSRRNTSGSLADVQASIIMTYVTYHLDGFSARSRFLSTAAASIARDLRLHQLDAKQDPSASSENDIRLIIDREVKRRVFWHIAATDWLQSTISGQQEGMYFIHPNHINVNLPKDCTDYEIVLGNGNTPIDGPLPTGMTFFLARVQLATLCREWTDIIPLETSKLLKMPYENIVNLDKRLEDFISGLPFFFRLDAESREKSRALETVYHKIPNMRYAIATAAHTRRCKLHQKFLLRQSSDPKYAYSRRACLESARAVIQLFEDPCGTGDSPRLTAARMGMAVHYTHLALMILVMDLCFNRNMPGEEDKVAEIQDGMQMLGRTRHSSPLLRRSLRSLHQVLQKYDVPLPDLYSSDQPNAMGTEVESATQRNGNTEPCMDIQTEPIQGAQDMSSFGVDNLFEDVWQTALQSDSDLGLVTWDNLFSNFDSQPI